MTDPKGNPGGFRDKVERLPMRPRCISVRARSAKAGSGTGGWSVVAPPLACFPGDEEVIMKLLAAYMIELWCSLIGRRAKRAIIASQKTRRIARLAQIPSASLGTGSSLRKERLFRRQLNCTTTHDRMNALEFSKSATIFATTKFRCLFSRPSPALL